VDRVRIRHLRPNRPLAHRRAVTFCSAQRVIAEGGWSVVVLQQDPSALPESQANLREYVQRFDTVIRSAVNALLYPVGEARRIAWRRDSRLQLYGPDGFHPSPAGTYVAALVIYQQISGRSVVGSPSPLSSIEPATVRVLQEAAAEANDRYARP